ncbi:DEAD/DEAH box helicase [Burkholderia contaminans]|nr:DEAD/DEAH box helicase [Burkholderia contaminans]
MIRDQAMRLADFKKPPRELITAVKSDGLRVGLSTAFSPWLTPFFRDEVGGTWQSRMWVFERSKIDGAFVEHVAKSLPKNYVFDVKAFAQGIKAALAAPEKDIFVGALDVQLFPVRGGRVAITSRYDPLVVRAVQGLSARFLRGRNAWVVESPQSALLEALESAAGVGREHMYIHETEIVLEELASMNAADRPTVQVDGMVPERGAAAEDGENAILTVVATPLAKIPVRQQLLDDAGAQYGLYDYQVTGVGHLLAHTSALLADDMGLGKSRQATVAGHLVEGEGAVLIGCPASLRINWQREILAVDPDAKIAIAGKPETWVGAGWIIVNYEIMGGVVQALLDGLVKLRAMILDEAHYLKEPDSTRTRNAFLVAAHVPRRFLLTATPILNREAELHTLLRLSGHPLGSLPMAEFLSTFAGSPEQRKALSERVSEWMLRRPKKVLKLKGKTHETQYVEAAPEQRAEYQRILADGSLTAVVKIGKLRRTLERMKSAWLVDTIASLASDDKSIIFCEFVESVETLADEFEKIGIKTVTFTGSDTPIKKQKAVDTFMVDEDTKVFIATTGAAGVGLNLTAANYVFFSLLPWTAAAKRQAEDRAYRNGQQRAVTVMIPIVPNTVDEQIVELIRYKESIEGDLLEDTGADEKAMERQMAAKLLEVA